MCLPDLTGDVRTIALCPRRGRALRRSLTEGAGEASAAADGLPDSSLGGLKVAGAEKQGKGEKRVMMDPEIAHKLILNAAEMIKDLPDKKLGHEAQMVIIASAQAYAQIASAMTLVRIAEVLEREEGRRGQDAPLTVAEEALILVNCASGSHEACEGKVEMEKDDQVEVWVCKCACHKRRRASDS